MQWQQIRVVTPPRRGAPCTPALYQNRQNPYSWKLFGELRPIFKLKLYKSALQAHFFYRSPKGSLETTCPHTNECFFI